MTAYNPDHPLVKAMRGWDRIVPTSECPHCHGTGLAPGDGHTECGFCTPSPAEVPPAGPMLTISERALRTLVAIAEKADEALLMGTCRDGRTLPTDPATGNPYCAECWAMQEAQSALIEASS